jgi:hypothetical protein
MRMNDIESREGQIAAERHPETERLGARLSWHTHVYLSK